MSLELSFLVAVTDTRRVIHQLITIDNLLLSIKQFHKYLTKANQIDIDVLLDTYHDDLIKMRFHWKEINDGRVTSYIDRIFKNILKIDGSKMPRGITLLFEEFVKGITYFKSQVDPQNPLPVYHRFASCGIGTDAFRQQHHVCIDTLNRTEKKEHREKVKRCYIERLIYDELWRMETLHFPASGTNAPSQDEGHIHRLKLTHKDFQTCFKNQDIKVKLNKDNIYPIECIIETWSKDKLVCEEIYKKEIMDFNNKIKVYGPIVTCSKKCDGVEYKKFQAFQLERAWTKVRL
jgi:hypothetical protein